MQVFGKHESSGRDRGLPPVGLMVGARVTPRQVLLARRRTGIPDVDSRAYRLSIKGLVKRPVIISLSTIRHLFTKVTVSAVGEDGRDVDDAGVAEWGGVPLREVLAYAGLKFGARHVAFAGLDGGEGDSQLTGFSGSIPLAAALNPEVILAYEMNGQPLTPAAGAPLRLIVPGHAGAHSIKWLGEITLLSSPLRNRVRRAAWRLFAPPAGPQIAHARNFADYLKDAWQRLGLFARKSAVKRQGYFTNPNHWQQAKF
jgi:sulfite oxidase